MYRIGEFSKMTKTTVKTLRYYDEVDLLTPEFVDPFTSYRFYTTNQLFALHKIQSYRQIGLSIEEIKQIINGQDVQFF
jgi:DNA-binding transcriptional MerR regulator